MAHQVKNLPAMQKTQETGVRALGREDPLVEDMATHSSILACGIPGTEEEPGGLYAVQGAAKGSDTTEQLSTPKQ